jgi:hypothetical protein
VLGALVATGAGASSGLAWTATGASVLLTGFALAVGSSAVGSSAAVTWSLALLAAVFLLRERDALVLAPVYAAGLLLAGELAQCSIDLRGVSWLSSRWIASRVATSLALGALGVCAGAIAAAVATISLARSVALTAAGALATIVALGTIVVLARRSDRVRPNPAPTAEDPAAPGARSA